VTSRGVVGRREAIAPVRATLHGPRPVRFVDLFCGIGGFHEALRSDPNVAEECVFACDIDPSCAATYEANFRINPARDILEITATDWMLDGAIPPHDLLCAGFPCQPFSKSGPQRGISEARGTLFHEICRVLEWRTPPYVLLENVRNLIGPRHRSTWVTIIRLLREIGYAVSEDPVVLSPHRLPPELGGLPQARERVFVPAVFVGRDRAAQLTALPPLVARQPIAFDPSTWDVVRILEPGLPRDLRADQEGAVNRWGELLRSVDGDVPGVALWMDALTGQLDQSAEFPAWKNQIIRANQRFVSRHAPQVRGWVRRHGALQEYHPSYRKFEWQARGEPLDPWCHSIQFRPSGIRIRPLTYLPALVAINHAPVIGPLGRRLSVLEGLRLQGFPETFALNSDTHIAFRHLGNAVAVGAVRFLLRAMLQPQSAERSLVRPDWLGILDSPMHARHEHESALAAS
jgi:DNA (cytosine-5)-methyltransferase 1